MIRAGPSYSSGMDLEVLILDKVDDMFKVGVAGSARGVMGLDGLGLYVVDAIAMRGLLE